MAPLLLFALSLHGLLLVGRPILVHGLVFDLFLDFLLGSRLPSFTLLPLSALALLPLATLLFGLFPLMTSTNKREGTHHSDT